MKCAVKLSSPAIGFNPIQSEMVETMVERKEKAPERRIFISLLAERVGIEPTFIGFRGLLGATGGVYWPQPQDGCKLTVAGLSSTVQADKLRRSSRPNIEMH